MYRTSLKAGYSDKNIGEDIRREGRKQTVTSAGMAYRKGLQTDISHLD